MSKSTRQRDRSERALADTFTADGLRYYVMRDIATGYDADFSDERIIMSYNKELAGGLGNLLQSQHQHGAKIPQWFARVGRLRRCRKCCLAPNRGEALPAYQEKMNAWAIHDGIAAAWKIVSHANALSIAPSPSPWPKTLHRQLAWTACFIT
jgi:methionyl-tRNA synthetase